MCAPEPHGTGLVFEERGGEVVVPLRLRADYESFPGVIHGGIIATILDEVMGRAVLHAHGRCSLTVALRVRFAQVMESGKPYLALAAVVSGEGSVVKVRGQIESARDGLVAFAEGSFRPLPVADDPSGRSGRSVPSSMARPWGQI